MSVVSMGGGFKRYLFEYRFDGSEWGFEIKAANEEEARARIKSLVYARYKGHIIATIPATRGPLGALAAWLKNIVSRNKGDSRSTTSG